MTSSWFNLFNYRAVPLLHLCAFVFGYRANFVVLPLRYLKLKLNLNQIMQRHRTKYARRLDLRNLSVMHPGKPFSSPSPVALQPSADLCLLSQSALCVLTDAALPTVALRTSPTRTQQGIKSRFSRTKSLLLTKIRSQILQY